MSAPAQTVIITGAAGHLGKAVAAAFRQRGARLVLVDRQQDALERAFGGDSESLLLPLDLLDREQVRSGLAKAVERFGPADTLCHVAGGFRMGEAVHETAPETWEFLFDLNARSFVNVANVVVPQLLERGSGKIVTVGAAAAAKGVAQMGAKSTRLKSVV